MLQASVRTNEDTDPKTNTDKDNDKYKDKEFILRVYRREFLDQGRGTNAATFGKDDSSLAPD